MIDLAWAVFTGAAWIFVLIWLVPYVIAVKREHRNKTIILVLSIICSLWPLLWFNAAGWMILLVYAAASEPVAIYVQGPAGPQGPPGKDAGEIPLSKAGVVKPKGFS